MAQRIGITSDYLLRRRRMQIKPSIPATVTGNPAVFSSSGMSPASFLGTADIVPTQDLHGYDAPWPPGARNMIPFPYPLEDGVYDNLTFTSFPDGRITITGTSNTEDIQDYVTGGHVLPAGTYTLSVTGKHLGATIDMPGASIPAGNTNASVSFYYSTATEIFVQVYYAQGATVDFDCYIQLERGGTASAYQPYSNICEITGKTGLTMHHASKNLSPVGSFIYPTDGTVCVIAENLLPGLTYNASAHRDSVTTTGSGIRIRFQYDVGGETIYDQGGYGSTGWMSKSCAVPANATNVRVAIQRASAVSGYTISDIQLELGEARTEYNEYHAFDNIPISWQSEAGAVYGGTLDLSTGVLTVTAGAFVCDGTGTTTIYTDGNSHGTVFRISKVNGFISYSTTEAWAGAYVLCSHFAKSNTRGATSFGANTVYVAKNNLYFCYGEPLGGTTLAEFETFINTQYSNGTPVTVVSTLETPQTYQLTRPQVQALVGYNQIWIDGLGTITVNYKKFLWEGVTE